MNWPALIFSSDLFPDQGPLNGRRWSSQLLLKLWLQSVGREGLHLLSIDAEAIDVVKSALANTKYKDVPLHWCSATDPNSLTSHGSLFVPDPSIGVWSAWRQMAGHSSFSLIGQIHTLSTSAVMTMLDSIVYEPVQEWDALICSSSAGKSVVEGLLHDRFDQLKHRMGAVRFPQPQLPVIPLPLAHSCFDLKTLSRSEARQDLGIPVNSPVVLWLGRLSMLTKSDPWPSYQVLQRVATRLGKQIWLVECGPDDTSHQADHFDVLRRSCPDVCFVRLGGSQPVSEQVKQKALVSCDLLLSLVDNIQETFGLSIAEAMAAGRPVVASNWDGYRDLIRHGIDGFLIPSRWDEQSMNVSFPLGWMQRQGLSNFPHISGSLAQLVQIDLSAAEDAVLTLLSDPLLASRMGNAAHKHALQNFSPDKVLHQFLELFEFLSDLRKVAVDSTSDQAKPPLRLDPVRCFSGFASQSTLFSRNVTSSNPLPDALVAARQPFADQLSAAMPQGTSLDWESLLKAKHL